MTNTEKRYIRPNTIIEDARAAQQEAAQRIELVGDIREPADVVIGVGHVTDSNHA